MDCSQGEGRTLLMKTLSRRNSTAPRMTCMVSRCVSWVRSKAALRSAAWPCRHCGHHGNNVGEQPGGSRRICMLTERERGRLLSILHAGVLDNNRQLAYCKWCLLCYPAARSPAQLTFCLRLDSASI